MSSSETALQRLEASRASIHAALMKLQGFAADDDTARPPGEQPSSPGWLSTAAPWLGTLRRALRLWWHRHPARPVVDVASDAGALALKPLVRRHPVAWLSLAMAAGAAMVVWRPWRSRITAAVWAGLGAQLTAGLVRSVLNPGTLMALLGSLPQRPSTPPPPLDSDKASPS